MCDAKVDSGRELNCGVIKLLFKMGTHPKPLSSEKRTPLKINLILVECNLLSNEQIDVTPDDCLLRWRP